jgi:Holliday junction resolvase
MGWGLKRNRTAWKDGLSQTTWQDFERLLAAHYRNEGFRVEHVGTAQNAHRFDGGVDLVLHREGETVLVQCKHWNANQVPHNDVHQLLGLVETRGATRAILVTSGEFTVAAREAASRSPRISLIDGAELRQTVDARMLPAVTAGAAIPARTQGSDWIPVVHKAVDAVMTVQTRGRWGRRRQSPEAALKELALRLLVAAILLIAGLMFVRSQIENLKNSVARPAAKPTSVQQSLPITSQKPRPARQVAPQQAVRQSSVPTTPEELKAWEEKNAEAMRILEKTTPSVYD